MHGSPETNQHDERFSIDDMVVQIGLHNYDFIYSKPGLYDQLLYDTLKCQSPRVVVAALAKSIRRLGQNPSQLTYLDIGAGPGNVGEEINKIGARRITNVDIHALAYQEAHLTRRDSFDEYYVVDLSDRVRVTQTLGENYYPQCVPSYDCLTMVAALSHDHIPIEGIETALDLVKSGGFIATCIGEDQLDQDTPLSRLMWQFVGGLGFRLHHFKRYRHRFTADGRELLYYCIVTQKL